MFKHHRWVPVNQKGISHLLYNETCLHMWREGKPKAIFGVNAGKQANTKELHWIKESGAVARDFLSLLTPMYIKVLLQFDYINGTTFAWHFEAFFVLRLLIKCLG